MLRRYVDTGVVEVLLTHNRYTLVDRSAAALIEHAVERGVAVFNGGVYGSGILAKGSAAYARYGYRDAEPAMLERVRAIETLCAEAGIPMAAAALHFSMRNPLITSTVVGMTSPGSGRGDAGLRRHGHPRGVLGRGGVARDDGARIRRPIAGSGQGAAAPALARGPASSPGDPGHLALAVSAWQAGQRPDMASWWVSIA